MFKRESPQSPTDSSHDSDAAQASMLRLSDDIGAMAERIGQMADRIGDMSERILETQRIQGENIATMQKSMNEAMALLAEQMKANNRLLELIVSKGMAIESPL